MTTASHRPRRGPGHADATPTGPRSCTSSAGAPLLAHALRRGRARWSPSAWCSSPATAPRRSRRPRAIEIDPDIVVRPPGGAAGHRPTPSPRRAPALEGVDGRRPRPLRRHALHPPRDAGADARRAGRGHDVVVLGFEAADPGRYGRLVMDGRAAGADRRVQGRDARPNARSRFCNSGVVCADARAAVRPGRRGRQRQRRGRILPDRHRRRSPAPRGLSGHRRAPATRPRRWASTPAPTWPRPRRPFQAARPRRGAGGRRDADRARDGASSPTTR